MLGLLGLASLWLGVKHSARLVSIEQTKSQVSVRSAQSPASESVSVRFCSRRRKATCCGTAWRS